MPLSGTINTPNLNTSTAEYTASGTTVLDGTGTSLGITFANNGQAIRFAALLNAVAGLLLSRTPG